MVLRPYHLEDFFILVLWYVTGYISDALQLPFRPMHPGDDRMQAYAVPPQALVKESFWFKSPS